MSAMSHPPDRLALGFSVCPRADLPNGSNEPIPAIAAALIRRPDRAADHQLASFSWFLLFFGLG